MFAQNGYFLLASLVFPGMKLIPLIVLLICSGFFLGAASILTSILVLKSRCAICFGLLAVAFGFLSPPLIWVLAGKQLSPHGYLFLACPILPGLLGVGLSQTAIGIWLRLARIAIAMTAIVGAILGDWYAESITAPDLIDVLHGSKKVDIAEFSIEHHHGLESTAADATQKGPGGGARVCVPLPKAVAQHAYGKVDCAIKNGSS